MDKTILIGCPTCGLDQDPSRWLDTLLKIQNQIRSMKMGQSFLAPYRMQWKAANDMIWDAAVQYDFDYILRLDDDVHDVPDDAMQKLLQEDKDVIGAAYLSRHYPHKWCALNKGHDPMYFNLIDIAASQTDCLEEIQEKSGIHKVDLLGFGMTLIKVAAFKNIAQPMFSSIKEDVPDDTIFAQICADNNISQFVHMDVKLSHRDITPMLRAK